MLQADDDIGHLHARVIDVILNLDVAPGGFEDSHEGIADRRVAQVTDVRRFVWIDVRVLDNDFSFIGGKAAQTAAADRGSTIEVEINVAGPGDFHALDAIDFSHLCDHFFRDRSRSSLQLTGKLKGNGSSEFSEL